MKILNTFQQRLAKEHIEIKRRVGFALFGSSHSIDDVFPYSLSPVVSTRLRYYKFLLSIVTYYRHNNTPSPYTLRLNDMNMGGDIYLPLTESKMRVSSFWLHSINFRHFFSSFLLPLGRLSFSGILSLQMAQHRHL